MEKKEKLSGLVVKVLYNGMYNFSNSWRLVAIQEYNFGAERKNCQVWSEKYCINNGVGSEERAFGRNSGV